MLYIQVTDMVKICISAADIRIGQSDYRYTSKNNLLAIRHISQPCMHGQTIAIHALLGLTISYSLCMTVCAYFYGCLQ